MTTSGTKSLAMKLLDHIMYLNRIGAISRQERIEFGNLINMAMVPGNERYYNMIHRKLSSKRDNVPFRQKSAIDEALKLISIDKAVSQTANF